MEHGVCEHPAGRGVGNGATERTCEAEDSLGARYGAGVADGQPTVCAGTDNGAAALLLQCDDALPVCAAAADLSDRTVDLPDAGACEYSRLLGGDSGICAAASGAG